MTVAAPAPGQAPAGLAHLSYECPLKGQYWPPAHTSAETQAISAAFTSSGQGIEQCLSRSDAASTCVLDQRFCPLQLMSWWNVAEDRPTLSTVTSNSSSSPKNDGLEKSDEMWTVGVPQRSSQMILCQGQPRCSQNSSFTAVQNVEVGRVISGAGNVAIAEIQHPSGFEGGVQGEAPCSSDVHRWQRMTPRFPPMRKA